MRKVHTLLQESRKRNGVCKTICIQYMHRRESHSDVTLNYMIIQLFESNRQASRAHHKSKAWVGWRRAVRKCAKKCIKLKQRALGDQMAMSNARRHISSISIELSYWFSLTLNLKNTLSPWHMAYGAREWETIGRTRWSYLILWFIGSPAKICVYFPFHLIYDWKAFASARDFENVQRLLRCFLT